MALIHDHEISIFMRWRSPCTFAEHEHENHQIDGCKGKPKSGREDVKTWSYSNQVVHLCLLCLGVFFL